MLGSTYYYKQEAADCVRLVKVPVGTEWTDALAECIYHIADHVRQTHPVFLENKLVANSYGVRLGGDPPGTVHDSLHTPIPWWDIYLDKNESTLVVRVTDMRFLRPAVDEDDVANRLEELLKMYAETLM
jgi:hypothetical protein